MADEKTEDTAPKSRKAAAPAEATLVEERKPSAERVAASKEHAEAEREALAEEASIGAAPSENIDASGAIMEPDTKNEIDVDHPAVDNNPRAGTTVRQNQIDFNDPNLTSEQAVKQRLEDGGSK